VAALVIELRLADEMEAVEVFISFPSLSVD
jgi:hypothetical protein